MTTAAERDKEVQNLVSDLLTSADENSLKHLSTSDLESLETLFSIKAWSFRDLLFTIVVGRILYPSYKPSVNLYDCSPRSIYEKGIRPILENNRIPCVQSGPLNVAKGIQALNIGWADTRRPKQAGEVILRLVASFESSGPSFARELGLAIAYKYSQQAIAVARMNSNISPIDSAATLGWLCEHLIKEAPDNGNTPQRICGLILKVKHPDEDVYGDSDSASTTNTTSKKPGDIGVLDQDGYPISVYEVTIKSFGTQRLSESNQAMRKYMSSIETESDLEIESVVQSRLLPLRHIRVLSRVEDFPSDAEARTPHLAHLEYEEISYDFADIFNWVNSNLMDMTVDQRRTFFVSLQEYVNQVNTSSDVKASFKSFFGAEE